MKSLYSMHIKSKIVLSDEFMSEFWNVNWKYFSCLTKCKHFCQVLPKMNLDSILSHDIFFNRRILELKKVDIEQILNFYLVHWVCETIWKCITILNLFSWSIQRARFQQFFGTWMFFFSQLNTKYPTIKLTFFRWNANFFLKKKSYKWKF